MLCLPGCLAQHFELDKGPCEGATLLALGPPLLVRMVMPVLELNAVRMFFIVPINLSSKSSAALSDGSSWSGK